ncbi:MAG: histidine kinase [Bacteroidales bacterium]|nr:histidine kinase [Bacteroidales bacterium]
MIQFKMLSVFILLLCLGHLTSGQEYSYKQYTIKDGLPQSQISALYQDSKGYIWIGTKAGLSRFDGVEFKNLYSIDGLSSDFICGIGEDSSNNIYALAKNGYNKITDDTIRYFKPDTNITFKWNQRIEVDNHNFLWNKFQRKDLVKFKNGKYTFLKKQGVIPDSLRILNFLYDSQKDRIYFSAGGDGVYYVYENQLHLFWKPSQRKSVRITQSPDGTIYGIDKDSIYRIEKHKCIPLLKSPSDNSRWAKYNWDTHGRFFIKKGKYEIVKFDGKSLECLDEEFPAVNRIIIDEERNLWIGTETGLSKSLSTKFINFTPENSGMIPYVYSIIEDHNGNFYFTSLNEGIVKYNGEEFQRITGYREVYSEDRFYMGGICDHNNNLIIPCTHGALKYTDGDFQKMDVFQKNEAVLDIYEDPDNMAKYFGTEKGLVIKKNNGNTRRYPVHPGGKSSGYITNIVKDSTGKYWLGGFNGLSWLKDHTIHHLPDSNHVYEKGAIALYRDYWDNIWLGTREGLYLYDYRSFRKIAGDNIYSYVVSLTGVDSSKLVLGMINQVATLDLQNFYRKNKTNIQTYDHTNGFMGNECIQNGMYTDSKGNVWIPTSDKVVKFMPHKREKKLHSPNIYIEKIKKLNHRMQWVDLSGTGGGDSLFRMPHTTNNLRFRYTGIDHCNPQGIRYQYKLEGNDEGWSELTGARYATYTNLEPGKYTFKVKAYTSNNIWSEKPASVKIHIQPALWQKTWFILLCIIAGAAGAAWLIYYYAQRHRLAKQRKAEYEKKMAEMKLLTIKNQLEPHFTFNALNSMASVVLNKENYKAYDYLSKFSKMIRLSLDHSDEIIRTLREEIDFVRHYLDIQKLRFDNKFDYKINIGDEVDMTFAVPKMIIHNYVENALKHGIKHKTDKGFIKIEIYRDNNRLGIEVEDNGIGRERAREIGSNSSGKGLKTLKEYCRIYNKYNQERIQMKIEDLYDTERVPSGTRVKIIIPLNYKYNVLYAES